MLRDRVIETWQSFSSVVWILKGAGEDNRRQKANVAEAAGWEEASGGSSDWEQPSPGPWRRDDAERGYTNSLHMSS